MADPTALLLAAANGDDDAFVAFVRATQADVWRFCAHLVDVPSADDLLQDTYVQVARSLQGFRATGSARAWLLTIARRTCADHLRRRRRRGAHETPTDPLTLAAVGPSQHPDHSHDLVGVLHQLAAPQREALVLTQLLGLDYAEAAQTVGVPIGTIRSRVARGRLALATLLEAHDPTQDVG